MIEPTTSQLVKEFGGSRQKYYQMQKANPGNYRVYCDAWKYRLLLEEIRSRLSSDAAATEEDQNKSK